MKSKGEIAEYLQRVSLFSRCSKRDLSTIAKLTEIERYDPGAKIVSEGEPGSAFYVVLEGSAVVRQNGRRTGELGPGDYFGELALLDPAPRNADVEAHETTTVARLGVGPFATMLRDSPTVNERLLAGLARRVRAADGRSVE
jgi:cAMP-dependent protein kinase regulator